MKAGWEVKPLGEVCEVSYGTRVVKKRDAGTLHPVYGGGGATFFVDQSNRNDCTIVARFGMSEECVRHVEGKFFLNDSGLSVHSKGANVLSQRFLDVQLFGRQLEIYSTGRGTAQKNLDVGKFRELPIIIPPFEEQKRIVAVLDAAFEGLTRAKQNAEANLQNARDLFEASQAKLLSDAGGGWFRKTISDCFKLKSGDGLTAKAMVHGEYAVYGGNGVAGHHNASNLTGENVIIGRVGALCGNARLIETDIWLTDNAFLVTDFQHDFDLSFLTFMLNFMNLRSFARQTAQPVISNSSLKDVVLSFPESRSTQTDIALKLLEIENEVEGLETNYRTKLTDISDLRQSLLQKAFAGELT